MSPAEEDPVAEAADNVAEDNEWLDVQAALERYFLARENGEAIDVVAACNGDKPLAERVLTLLGGAPDVILGSSDELLSPTLTSFGDFDVVESIGKGGMGTVYLAIQRSLGRQVALKVMDHAALDMPSSRLRMRREAELTAHLNHPNIVPVYAVGEVGEVPFIAMKYLNGPSLAEVERPWPAQRVAEIGVALAEALDIAHVNGIVHRDVKPANILLDDDKPVFVDFGLARAQSDPTLTQEGKVAGTLRYMAPERLDATSPVLDPRVDIYGLGATLYELLSGHEVFADQMPTALVRSVLSRDPEPLGLSGREHDLETIVLRALAKEPARRFTTARDMADDLARYLRGEPVTSRRMSRTARVLRQAQRHPRVVTLIAAAITMVAVTLGVLFVQNTNEAADQRRRIAAARQDYHDARHARAYEVLQLLAERYPSNEEVQQLLVKAGAEVATDKLLVALSNRTVNVDQQTVSELMAAGNDTPASKLCAVLALAQTKQQELATQRLAELPKSYAGRRATRATSALLSANPLPWSLPPIEGDITAVEVMLTSLALRLAGAAPTAVLAELESVAPQLRSERRLVWLEAIVRTDLGQLQVSADLLRGLAGPEAPPPIWRLLALAQLGLGRLREAGESLRQISGDTSHAAKYLRLQHQFMTLEQSGDRTGIDQQIREVRETPDRSAEMERFLAEYDGKRSADAVPAAIARLEQLLASEELDWMGRDLTTAAMIELAAWHLPSNVMDESVNDVATCHREMLATWRERGLAIRYPIASLSARTWLARSMCRSESHGDLAAGLEMLRSATAKFPGRTRPAHEYAVAAGNLSPKVPQVIRQTHAIAARQAIDTVLAQPADSGLLMRSDLSLELRYYAWQLAWTAGDLVEMARRMPEIEDGIPPGSREDAEKTAQWVQQTLKTFRAH